MLNIGNTQEVKQILNKKVASPYASEMVAVPLLGSAPCGNPFFAEENTDEMIMVDKSKLKPGTRYFIVRASGDSMDQAGINDGDLVLCRYGEKGETGDRVVALIGGENVTIKYYDKKDGRRILLPKSSNPEHKPILPDEGDSVQGVVQEIINKK
jgi:repressor LexA